MKNKYLFGGIIIVVFLGIMIYLFTQTNVQYESSFVKVMQSGKTVKATGTWLKERSYEFDKENKIFSFYIKDENGNIMKVVYHGVIPNNFESSTSVVVTGKYSNGVFHATDILTKCPSKYQEQTVQKAKS
ncbi:MAG: cytochrome c maturation protein CcmE [Melioribacter sp.]|uniref:cytochrome c maturation protein CcmE domain-containing protein n=1 Tax=Rosettibacter primus TaxID=3111523 RepID=UPI00247D14E9|nr:cytochrome c maturation protein CcmE [Melioribacter sp.]